MSDTSLGSRWVSLAEDDMRRRIDKMRAEQQEISKGGRAEVERLQREMEQIVNNTNAQILSLDGKIAMLEELLQDTEDKAEE